MWGITPPPAMVALMSVSSSSSPRMASCKWRGVIRFTFRSLEAFPASSSTSAVRYSRMAAVYTAAVAPTRPLDVTRLCAAGGSRRESQPQVASEARNCLFSCQLGDHSPLADGGYDRRGTEARPWTNATWASSCHPSCLPSCLWHPCPTGPWLPCPTWLRSGGVC